MATNAIQPSPGPSAVSFSVVTAARTDPGRKRGNNEDSHLILPLDGSGPLADSNSPKASTAGRGLLLAVADGMGGYEGGEIASGKCIEILSKEMSAGGEIPSEGLLDSGAALERAVIAAHEAVFAISHPRKDHASMGTTLTAALLCASRAQIAQVGDSRAYLFRKGKLSILTEDQTYGTRIRQDGGDPSMLSDAVRESLTQAIGTQREIKPAMTAADLEPEDMLLLCCDGLHKVVAAEVIAATLESKIELKEMAEKLVELANNAGGPDNITVLLAEFAPVNP